MGITRETACWGRTVAMGLVVCALASGAWGADKAGKAPAAQSVPFTDAAAQKSLDTLVSFSFEVAPIKDVVDFFRQQTGANIYLEGEATANQEYLVTMRREKTHLRDALRIILGGSLAYTVRDGAIVVSTRERIYALAPRVTRVYEVEDILASAKGRMPEADLVSHVLTVSNPSSWNSAVITGATDAADAEASSVAMISNAANDPPRDTLLLWSGRTLIATAPEEVQQRVVAALESLRSPFKAEVEAFLVSDLAARVEAVLAPEIRPGRKVGGEWEALKLLARGEGLMVGGCFSSVAGGEVSLDVSAEAGKGSGARMAVRVLAGKDGKTATLRGVASLGARQGVEIQAPVELAVQNGERVVLAACLAGGQWRVLVVKVTLSPR